MSIFHKGHTDTIQVYSVTVMTHAKALQAGHSSQGTSEPITPVCFDGRAGMFRWPGRYVSMAAPVAAMATPVAAMATPVAAMASPVAAMATPVAAIATQLCPNEAQYKPYWGGV